MEITSNKEYTCTKHGYIAGYVLSIDARLGAIIKRKKYCIACISELLDRYCGEVVEDDS